MNERVMQFRIGMFVIVAGLVLTMMIVWFGESPSLFRDDRFITVHFPEAPGIAVGIPVRKSGIRIGEVAALKFDDRPGAGDGVLVTLSIQKQYPLAGQVVPRLSRALIGDVSIDMLPGDPGRKLVMSPTPTQSLAPDRIIEGNIAPDPANALAAATKAFERAGATLEAIDRAANGIAKLSDSADSLNGFLGTWNATGQKLGTLAEDAQKVIDANRESIPAAVASIRDAGARVNETLDPKTQEYLRETIRNLSAGSARLDRVLADLGPVAADMGAAPGTSQKTNLGQVLVRANTIAYQVGLLTSQLADPSGRRLNPNGTLQKLVMDAQMYENFNRASLALQEVLNSTRPLLRNLNTFAERISRDPSVLGRGVLQR